MSIHIRAEARDIADTVLLPGDPLRARFVAEEFLEAPQLFNDVRGMLGYTGSYKGKPVSVMGTGMGMPSHSIYVHELIHEFGAKRLIRIGSCGSIQEPIGINSIIMAMSACFDSSLNQQRFRGMGFAPTADFRLLQQAAQDAGRQELSVHVGSILSSDVFYDDEPDSWKLWAGYGVLAVEMETAALYTLAAQAGVEALSVLTVSDSLITGQALSSEQRERSFAAMVQLGLGLA